VPGQRVVAVIVDFDDYSEEDNRLDLLESLKRINHKFKCTVFAIPARGSEEFWRQTPDWIELAVHGWWHPTPREAENWTYEQSTFVFDHCDGIFTHGFKAPGWQISDETYRAAMDRGWWIADHWENDARRPEGLLCNVVTPEACRGEDPNHWHGHIPNVSGNGIEETYKELAYAVLEAEHFEFVSESVAPCKR
jgi:hypothetical protein